MRFDELADVYAALEATSKRLEKRDIVAELLRRTPSELLDRVPLLVMGRVFPTYSGKKLEYGEKLFLKAASSVSGFTVESLERRIRDLGDIGLAVEACVQEKPQTSLLTFAGGGGERTLTVTEVHDALRRLAQKSGADSQSHKAKVIIDLLSNATALEARYLARLVLEQMRVGVGEGVMRDAIALAYEVEPAVIERAHALVNDYGRVAVAAREGGQEALDAMKLAPGTPLKCMLAQKVPTVEEGLTGAGGTAAFEYKYDGIRLQVHRDGDKITLFTRRLENVTRQFPEIVEAVRDAVKAERYILEGELVAVDETGMPLPFQELSRRVRRKYDIERMVRAIPVILNIFDVLIVGERTLVELPLRERRQVLESIVEESDRVLLSRTLVTDNADEAREFYEEALSQGHEGAMIKNLDAPYQAGSRVGYMYKLKPTLETLDVVVVGAEWGEGRRASWFGSFLLAVRDGDGFALVGRMGTGLTDEQFSHITEVLRPLMERESGREVTFTPRIVVEVAYEELQQSPTYDSGYALRFPRLVRFRDDLGTEDADDVDRLRRIYTIQKARG